MAETAASEVFVFSVSYIGDLVLATLTFDLLTTRASALTVIAADRAAALMAPDSRVREVRRVVSSHPVTWRLEVMRHLLEARRRGAMVVNMEVYPPRWRFVRAVCRLLRTPTLTLDLPGLISDNRRSSEGASVVHPHRSHYYAQVAGWDGGEPPLPRLVIDSEAARRVAVRLAETGSEGLAKIVVHPSSSEARRRAPVSLYAGTLRQMAKRAPIMAILVGTAVEGPLCNEIAGQLGQDVRVWNAAGSLQLPELVALIGKAALFVGNDSGPLKIAEAVGARTLSFWGPTAAHFAGPRGPFHRGLRFDVSENDAARDAIELLGAPAVLSDDQLNLR